MSERRIVFRCILREDMHSGSGLGWLGLTDDRQARDARGRPVVWASTLIGLLRDIADELTALGHPLATAARVRRLFGTEGAEARSSVAAVGLHFGREPVEADMPIFLDITSTAREVHSRRPLDDTLRTIELAAAGLTATGQVRFRGDEDDQKLVELCLRRLASIGGGKTRGVGQIQLHDIRMMQALLPQTVEPYSQGPCRLRLLLQNLEPLCLAATGFPGNIITCESYLPGQALRGAFLTGLTESGASEADMRELARPDLVQFGNGYYVPEKREDLRLLSSIPLPLTAEEAKPTERKADMAAGPWWCQPLPAGSGWLADPERERDLLSMAEPSQEGDPLEADSAKFKRIKAEDYLVRYGSGPLRRVRPALDTIMRNRTPVARAGRLEDSRRPHANADDLRQERGDLFSQSVLVEDQFFLADIRFETARAAQLFADKAALFLGGPVEERSWLRLGRGGRPVRVEAWQWLDDETSHSLEQGADAFTLTLASDLIARRDDLAFWMTLDGETLKSLTGLDVDTGLLTVNQERSVSEIRVVHGFNTAAGTRRNPAVAIKRGSAFLIRSSHSSHPAALQAVFRVLAEREAKGQGLGERQEEGFGRFVLNHQAHRQPATGQVQAQGSSHQPTADESERRRAERENAIARVLDAVEQLRMAEVCQGKAFPSRSQWQRLRHDVEVIKKQEELDNLIGTLSSHAGTLSGKMWSCLCPPRNGKPLIEELDRHRKIGSLAAQRTFLMYFARWVVAQLDRLRREKKG
jgi:hypothetical protein